MKLKHIALIGSLFPILFSLVLFFGVLISADSDDENSNFSSGITGMNLSAEVLKHQPMVEKYARENGISEYVNVLLAIIQVESGGTAEDVMQSSESLGLPPNSLDTESSIKQGCKYFASLLSSCQNQGIDDLNVAIQSYNYGGGYVGYVAGKGKKHTFNLAENFAREKSGGKKVTYTNPIAVAKNGGWRYGYGNMFYVELVNQYLTVSQVSGELAQKVMNEALKYQGWKYVYGGSNPNTSFDCSGLTQWCYGKAGISLPRTAQAQYDATQHLPLSQAKAGDLVFFHSTYNAGSYVTHVGILVSPTQMYHAGNPIAVAKNGGWRYGYGNMFYVELVNQYLTVAHFDNATAQAIMNEALKYQGWKYVYGGSNPNTSFDCSGLVQWCYGKAGISLPRTAQAQYDATQHLPLSQAKAGDLVFFHSTYNAGSYVTHVGIYVGNNQMYHAGDPIGYADLSSSYWQQHLIGAGRVKQ